MKIIKFFSGAILSTMIFQPSFACELQKAIVQNSSTETRTAFQIDPSQSLLAQLPADALGIIIDFVEPTPTPLAAKGLSVLSTICRTLYRHCNATASIARWSRHYNPLVAAHYFKTEKGKLAKAEALQMLHSRVFSFLPSIQRNASNGSYLVLWNNNMIINTDKEASSYLTNYLIDSNTNECFIAGEYKSVSPTIDPLLGHVFVAKLKKDCLELEEEFAANGEIFDYTITNNPLLPEYTPLCQNNIITLNQDARSIKVIGLRFDGERVMIPTCTNNPQPGRMPFVSYHDYQHKRNGINSPRLP